MLKELHLKNFKSFGPDAQPIPFAPVTVFVGANGSGKSNVFDAFRLLQGIGAGLEISEILAGQWRGGRSVRAGMRGGATEVCFANSETFSIQARGEYGFGADIVRYADGSHREEALIHDVTHELHCRPSAGHVVTERLAVAEDPGDAIDGNEFGRFLPCSRSLLAEIQDHPEVEVQRRFAAGVVLNYYENFHFLELHPAGMKAFVPVAADGLGEHGENLSAVLRRICLDPEREQHLLDWLAKLCAPAVRKIDFEETKTDDVMVKLWEGDGDETPMSARSLSDGTLRFMGYLAAMFSAPEGSLFLIEEIENGLHPTRVHLLVELFEQFAESRNLQIVATTHSSQVLLSLSDKALRDAVVFARVEDRPGTVTSRLGDLPHFDEVTQKTHIDKLFTTGWLEFAL